MTLLASRVRGIRRSPPSWRGYSSRPGGGCARLCPGSPRSCRGRLALGLVILAAAAPGANAAPREADLSPAESLLERSAAWGDARKTVARGLAYLKRQVKDSGAVGSRYMVAVTSLAGLAVLGAGHQPGQEPYGPMLKSSLDYILASSDNGFFTEPGESESRMHGHCYAVLFLCEILGSLEPEDEERVSTAIKKAVLVIEKAQSREGGWFYWAQNGNNQDEASVTVCALQALRAARNVGFLVDSQRIERAIRYVKRCQNPRGDGSFAYSLNEPNRTSYALSVAALSTLNAAGVYESPELRKGLDFVTRALDTAGSPWKAAEEEYSYYANLYAAQALYQDGKALWSRWYPSVRDHLISKQRSDGSWDSRFGSEYATAAAILILEVPLGYLPIFQR